MTSRTAYICRRVFDGHIMHEDAALLVDGGACGGVVAASLVPADYDANPVDALCIAPSFVDLQVNGGGGAQFNDDPSFETIECICAAHRKFGTGAAMVTLITDAPEITARAIDAARTAQLRDVPGFLGLHLEGPHLSLEKKGAHDPNLIRSMSDEDCEYLVTAKQDINYLMATIAPESVTPEQVRCLSGAGIRVSIGHTACPAEEAYRYADAGATMVTHLYNAMGKLDHRAPGLPVGAMLDARLMCGIIADGVHVHPDMLRLAHSTMAERLFIVTDAMATIGTKLDSITLNDRKILRRDGRLTLADGTLAGADIGMAASVGVLIEEMSIPIAEALAMATSIPARAIGAIKQGIGVLEAGLPIQAIAVGEDWSITHIPT